jgi:hypothetical protein
MCEKKHRTQSCVFQHPLHLCLMSSTLISFLGVAVVMHEVLCQDIPCRNDQISCILELIGQVGLKEVLYGT